MDDSTERGVAALIGLVAYVVVFVFLYISISDARSSLDRIANALEGKMLANKDEDTERSGK